MQSQKFIDTRTGKIVTHILLSEIQHFEKYQGAAEAGDFDSAKLASNLARADDLLDQANEQIGELNDEISELKKPQTRADWLDQHLEIIGLPDGMADRIKNRLRREL